MSGAGGGPSNTPAQRRLCARRPGCGPQGRSRKEGARQDKLDDLHGHEERDGDQVGEQDPERQEEDAQVLRAALVVTCAARHTPPVRCSPLGAHAPALARGLNARPVHAWPGGRAAPGRCNMSGGTGLLVRTCSACAGAQEHHGKCPGSPAKPAGIISARLARPFAWTTPLERCCASASLCTAAQRGGPPGPCPNLIACSETGLTWNKWRSQARDGGACVRLQTTCTWSAPRSAAGRALMKVGEREMVPRKALRLAPVQAGRGAREAEDQLHRQHHRDLHVQERVERACRPRSPGVRAAGRFMPLAPTQPPHSPPIDCTYYERILYSTLVQSCRPRRPDPPAAGASLRSSCSR